MKKQKLTSGRDRILAGIKRGVKEVNLITAGKKKATLLKDFLNEL